MQTTYKGHGSLNETLDGDEDLHKRARLAAEGIVQPAIDEGIVAHRTHGDPVRGEEDVCGGLVSITLASTTGDDDLDQLLTEIEFHHLEVDQRNVQVQWQPTRGEHQHHNPQHLDAILFASQQRLAMLIAHDAHRVRSLPKEATNVVVEDHGQADREEVLRDRREDGDEDAMPLAAKVTDASDHVGRAESAEHHHSIVEGVRQRERCRRTPNVEDCPPRAASRGQ